MSPKLSTPLPPEVVIRPLLSKDIIACQPTKLLFLCFISVKAPRWGPNCARSLFNRNFFSVLPITLAEMKAGLKILSTVALLAVLGTFYSFDAHARLCLVTMETDSATNSFGLRYHVNLISWSERETGCTPQAESVDEYLFEESDDPAGSHQFVWFATHQLGGYPAGSPVDEIRLSSPLTFNNSEVTTWIGNAPRALPPASSYDYDYPAAYNPATMVTWSTGLVHLDGRTSITAANQPPLRCGTGAQEVVLRNVIINTHGLTKDQLFGGSMTSCLRDGGWVYVCPGLLDLQRNPSGSIRNPSNYPNAWCDDDADGFTVDEGDVGECTTDITRGPGNPEDEADECDGIDNDCDGETDEGLQVWYYSDRDGDGYGRFINRSFRSDIGSRIQVCPQPGGQFIADDGTIYVANNDDCDDSGADGPWEYPGADETCDGDDDDCDGETDETFTDLGDACSDGTGACFTEGTRVCNADGDDTICSVSSGPGVPEVCGDGIDNDCDGDTDEACVDPREVDNDGDCFCEDFNGNGACVGTLNPVGCPAGATAGDCDDANVDINIGETEICDDGIDNNCNLLESEGCPGPGETDGDGDGYCEGVAPCGDAPLGTLPGDCDDGNAAINPSAGEVACNGIDDNCDGGIDENAVPEVCDDVDNDCNGLIDDDSTNATAWYVDADADGYGEATTLLIQCDRPEGYVEDATDCDDTDNLTHPGATEMCGDRKDNNCDTDIDEPAVWFADSDGDTFGHAATAVAVCVRPEGYVDNSQDCDDTDASLKPGETEICDGLDNDCNNLIDDVDRDGDGFYGCRRTSDCSDTDASINPDANEVCQDGIDNDCDGVRDEGCSGEASEDDDGDGYCEDLVACSDNTLPGDCQDANPFINPGMEENCGDGVDNNCDGISDLTDATCDDTVPPPPPDDDDNVDEDGDDSDEVVPPGGFPAAIEGGSGCGCDLSARNATSQNPTVWFLLVMIPVLLFYLPIRILRRRLDSRTF